MNSREPAKRRAARIPLDYYKHRDGIRKVKLGLSFLAAVAAVVWLVGDDSINDLARAATGRAIVATSSTRANHGPIHQSHAMFENRCEVCHSSFQPMDGAHWSRPYLKLESVESDRLCSRCHAPAVHAAHQKPESVPSCAACHRDHQGRDASLASLPDGSCVGCHRDLTAHQVHPTEGGSRTVEEAGSGRPAAIKGRVTNFSTDHPEFRALAVSTGKPVDPGHLRFNHALHLSPGMRQGFSTQKLGEPDRARYHSKTEGAQNLVALRCIDCHVLDAADQPMGPANPTTDSGAYYQPIKFENHCAACHPLTFDTRKTSGNETKLAAIRHGLQPLDIHQELFAYYAGERYRQESGPEAEPRRRMPGPPPREQIQAARRDIARSVLQAERTLFLNKQTCAECHDYLTHDNEVLNPSVLAIEENKPLEFTIRPTGLKQIWMQGARFDHVAHRALECRGCHGEVEKSETQQDVLLPSIATCRGCHESRSSNWLSPHDGSEVPGKTSARCTDCHRYHNLDNPLEGRGSLRNQPRVLTRIEQFLSGQFNKTDDEP